MERTRLSDLLIDDVTWGCATRARRAEWQQTIAELLEEAAFSTPRNGPLRAYLTVHKGGIAMDFHDPAGQLIGQMALTHNIIAPVLKEYMGIIREMVRSGNGQNSPKLEALDIAKKLTHDDAAELLQMHFRDIRPDHPTARRLFTLLVVVTHDTTRLSERASA